MLDCESKIFCVHLVYVVNFIILLELLQNFPSCQGPEGTMNKDPKISDWPDNHEHLYLVE